VLNLASAQLYVEEDGVVGFAAESEGGDVEVDSDDPDFVEESEAAGLLSPFLVSPFLLPPLLSAAGAALVSDELPSDALLSDELDADLGA
jgi:hypothetical protein